MATLSPRRSHASPPEPFRHRGEHAVDRQRGPKAPENPLIREHLHAIDYRTEDVIGDRAFRASLPPELLAVHDLYRDRLGQRLGPMPFQGRFRLLEEYNRDWKRAEQACGRYVSPFFCVVLQTLATTATVNSADAVEYEQAFDLESHPHSGERVEVTQGRFGWYARIYGIRRRRRKRARWEPPKAKGRWVGDTSEDPVSSRYPFGRAWLNTVYWSAPDKVDGIFRRFSARQNEIAYAYFVARFDQKAIATIYEVHPQAVSTLLRKIRGFFRDAELPDPKPMPKEYLKGDEPLRRDVFHRYDDFTPGEFSQETAEEQIRETMKQEAKAEEKRRAAQRREDARRLGFVPRK